jgi:hypothetical protein
MVMLQHVELLLAVLTSHNMTLNQHLAQLINQLPGTASLRHLQPHPPHRCTQLPSNLLQPPPLIHLLKLPVNQPQPLLQLQHLNILLIHVLTHLRHLQRLQPTRRLDQPLQRLFMHSPIRFYHLNRQKSTSVIAISLLLSLLNNFTSFFLYS